MIANFSASAFLTCKMELGQPTALLEDGMSAFTIVACHIKGLVTNYDGAHSSRESNIRGEHVLFFPKGWTGN